MFSTSSGEKSKPKVIPLTQSREQVPFDGEIFSPRKDWARDFRHLASGLLRASITSRTSSRTSSEIPKRAPFLKLFNVEDQFILLLRKAATLTLEGKADRKKIFIRTKYALAIKFGWHPFEELFVTGRRTQVRASIISRLDEWSLKYLEHGKDGETD